MVVHYGPKPPVDMNVISSLPNIVSDSEAPVYSEKESYSYAGSNKVGVLAHGYQGVIFWNGKEMTGQQFAHDELIAKGIDTNANLKLWSCQAGTKTGPTKNDSLVDAVKSELDVEKTGNSIKVSGVGGGPHIVLNDLNEHYSLKSGVQDADLQFESLRNKYLKEVGFFPMGVAEDQYKHFIMKIDDLFKWEKGVNYETYCEQKRMQWNQMCAKLRIDPNFPNIMDKVDSSWYEVPKPLVAPTLLPP